MTTEAEAGGLQPVESGERITSIDTLRGFSLLGILLLNIVSFGLPFAAYLNPSVYGGSQGIDLNTWLVAQTFFDGKMRAIFSMLFGAGFIILASRAERRGAGLEAADIYYRRTLWLILFGLLHAHLIWAGDILYPYGVVGLLLFPLRKASSRALIIAALVVVTLHSLQNVGAMFGIRQMREQAQVDRAVATAGGPLTHEQRKRMVEWTELELMFATPPAEVEKEIRIHRGGYLENLAKRSAEASMFEFTMFFQFMFADVLGMLLLGMGLAKARVFDASRSVRTYVLFIVVGFGLGLPLNYVAAKGWIASGFGIPEYFGYIGTTSDPGRLLVAGAYIGLVMLICKSGVLRWATSGLAAVGRMALSNYLLTSILMTLFFNGYGLGYFGRLQRHQLYYVVAGMWAINLIWSPLWLRHFRYGPAEWVWRSLTYWKKQPMRRRIEDELMPAPTEPSPA